MLVFMTEKCMLTLLVLQFALSERKILKDMDRPHVIKDVGLQDVGNDYLDKSNKLYDRNGLCHAISHAKY